MTIRSAGYGFEAFGDPFGAGGPLHVVRARAMAGQVVRVVFDETPTHQSGSGRFDALNPSNYVVTVTSGQAVAPQVISVDLAMLVGPCASVAAGDERAFDVRTDRPLIAGIGYRVTARNITSQLGGALGSPYSADFVGVVRVQTTRKTARPTEFVDVAENPLGGFRFASGDLAIQGGVENLRKRVLRRWATPKNSYVWLPGYGSDLVLKRLAHPGLMPSMKSDLLAQVKLEPEVDDAKITLSLSSVGIMQVAGSVRTKREAIAELGMQVSNGKVLVL